MSGVGFKNTIENRLENLPVGLSDRIMTLNIPLLQDGLFATLISIYAPSLQANMLKKHYMQNSLNSSTESKQQI